MAWKGFGATHIGKVRQSNQDAFGMDNALQFFVVADGMGGHAGGEVASRIAVNTIMGSAQTTLADTLKNPRRPDTVVRTAIELANQAVRVEARERPELSGMGTTATLLWIPSPFQDQAIIANIGDSRAYLLRNNTISQLSKDHSWVIEQIQQGLLTPEEARNHHMRHIVTRAVGVEPTASPDVLTIDLFPKDQFLLCTDGLTKMMTDEEILDALSTHQESLENQCHILIEEANRLGGNDNITVVMVEQDGRE